jgi:hypothetical protein
VRPRCAGLGWSLLQYVHDVLSLTLLLLSPHRGYSCQCSGMKQQPTSLIRLCSSWPHDLGYCCSCLCGQGQPCTSSKGLEPCTPQSCRGRWGQQLGWRLRRPACPPCLEPLRRVRHSCFCVCLLPARYPCSILVFFFVAEALLLSRVSNRCCCFGCGCSCPADARRPVTSASSGKSRFRKSKGGQSTATVPMSPIVVAVRAARVGGKVRGYVNSSHATCPGFQQ